MKKPIWLLVLLLLVALSSSSTFAATPTPTPTPYPPISDPALSTCPAEDNPPINPAIPPLGRGNYPFPEERPTVYSQPAGTKTGRLSMNQSCDNVQADTKTCVSSNMLMFNFLGSPCPNGYTQDSDGCYLEVSITDTVTPKLAPSSYRVHDRAGCWSSQTIDVNQGCVLNGSLACQNGGSGLTVDCNGAVPSPTPTPLLANKDSLLKNGLPAPGKTCAIEISTPIEFPKDFCVSSGSSGTLQIQPKSARIPGAQDTGQYLSGTFDTEHLYPTEINKYYDETLGLPLGFLGIPGIPRAKGASAAWNLSGPVTRLTPELEQDKLRHEFISWLCEKQGDDTQGRVPKSLNTRYINKWPDEWLIQAPLMGSQIPANVWLALKDPIIKLCQSFPPPPGFSDQDKNNACATIFDWFDKARRDNPIIDLSNPIRYKPCEIYEGRSWPNLRLGPINLPSVPGLNMIFPVGDVYTKKMASQCKNPDGTPIPVCIRSPMYRPNMIEAVVWDRVPLFANEEGKGEISLQVCNSDPSNKNSYVRIPVAVPQVFRLSSASAYLQQMLLSSVNNQKNRQAMNLALGPTPPDNHCTNCQDAQNGPPDTETFINYNKGYGDTSRGKVDYQSGGAAAQSDKDTITVRNNVPFLLNIWYQTAGGPFGIFNIFRPFRPSGNLASGFFQPTGKPFSSDGTFLDTPGSSLVQYSGAGIKKDVWKLLYSKIAGVWNAKNWIMQAVAPYCLKLKGLTDCPQGP